MKKEQGRKLKSGAKKASGRKTERKNVVKMRVTGNTEILDFDLLEEELKQPEGKSEKPTSAKKTASRIDGTKKAEKKESKTAAKTVGGVKAEKPAQSRSGKLKKAVQARDEKAKRPILVSDETLELLELDELLAADAGKKDSSDAGAKAVKESGTNAHKAKKEPGVDTQRAKSTSKSHREDDSYLTFEPKKKTQAGGKPEKRAAQKSADTGKKKERGSDFGFVDVMIALTGMLVLIVGGIAFGVYRNAADVEEQVAAVAEVGEKMETIGIAGESIFVAVADARVAAQEIANELPTAAEGEEKEYEEKDLVSKVNVALKLTSVQRDLKIKFTNKESGKLIGNQAFTVKIEGPEKLTMTDDDKDGIIYISSIKPGEYTVTITAPDEIDGNTVSGVKGIVTVKDQIEYKKIDVTDEVKKESEINVAKEDTAVAPPVESTVTDTVEWVESTKTPLNGEGGVTYEQVNKSDIPEPSSTALLDMIWTADGENGSYLQNAVKLEQNAALTGAGMVKTLERGAYFTQEETTSETESAAETRTAAETESPTEITSEPATEPAGPDEPPAKEFKVTKVSISGGKDCVVGDTLELTADVQTEGDGELADSDYSWSGAEGSRATAKFSADSPGDHKVELTVKGVSASVTISVKEKPAEVTVSGISVSADTSRAETGKSVTVTATVSMSDGSNNYSGTIDWSVSGGEFSGSGTSVKVSSGSAQKVKVTAKAGGKEASAEVEFYDPNVKDVAVSMEDPGSVAVGGEKTLKCTTTGEIESTEWSVSDTNIATIDKDSGKVKGVGAGETKVTVKVKGKDGKEATAEGKLTVTAAKVELKLDTSSLTLKVGEKKTIKATVETDGKKAMTWKTGDAAVLKITESTDDSCTVEALKAGKTTIVATSSADESKTAKVEVTVELNDGTALLKDKNGNQLYYKSGDEYKEATVADYYKYDVFYRKKDSAQYLYTGWQTIDGARYYFDKNGVAVTGDQVIQGVKYSFNSDGSLKVTGAMGIDISKHNGNIDWNAVKNAGVNYVILRCGYRGSATGVLVEDEKFKSNIQGAQAAGLKVGIYFFSQAVNEVEAVEEASLTLSLIRNYKITYPVYMDVEAANGRADGLDSATRTKVIKAFCETIRNSGYTAGVYANKTWLGSMMNVGSLSNYKIWLAQYAATPTYSGRYEMWQYSSTGKIAGISGNVDLNISYMSY